MQTKNAKKIVKKENGKGGETQRNRNRFNSLNESNATMNNRNNNNELNAHDSASLLSSEEGGEEYSLTNGKGSGKNGHNFEDSMEELFMDETIAKRNENVEYRSRRNTRDSKSLKDIHHIKDSTKNNIMRGNNCNKEKTHSRTNSMNIAKNGTTGSISVSSNSKEFISKLQTFKVRTIWTLILILFYFVVLAAGHLYCSLLVLILVTIVYREIVSLKSIENKDKKLPEIFYIRWYWFFLTIVTLGIPWLIPKLKFQKPYFNFLLAYHSIIMFISAFFGFVWFILSLRKFSLKYQFSQIGIILLSSLFIVAQSLMHIANIYSGLIWFFVPVTSVVVNDIFAYIFGILFGKTRLLMLSPKKTVEGYVGSSVITIVWGVMVTYILQRYKFFTCPQSYITFKPFETWRNIDCEQSTIFQQKVYVLPKSISSVFFFSRIYYTKMLFHGLVLSLFAAFLAPFGGFFASGFKRALKIKDFGKSIPGHGGVTDRFDCQIFIGMFTYIYMKTFAKKKTKTYSYYSVLDYVKKLDSRDQVRLFNQLKTILEEKEYMLTDKKDNNNEEPKEIILDEIISDDDIL